MNSVYEHNRELETPGRKLLIRSPHYSVTLAGRHSIVSSSPSLLTLDYNGVVEHELFFLSWRAGRRNAISNSIHCGHCAAALMSFAE